MRFGSSALVALRRGQIVGDLQVRVRNAWSQAEVADQARGTQAELSWCLAPQHQGQGYGVESVQELVSIAFELGGGESRPAASPRTPPRGD